MGGFNPPVPQQDNNWEIRVAVLLSLLLQVLILFLGHVRKRSSFPVARFAIWSSYLLADWVADLALGLLLNNMGNIGGNSPQHASGLERRGTASAATAADSSSPIIFAFWTPFLLVHLGGQDSLTALSIQDNDLWQRNLTGFAFQLFSACVIFFCSLEANPMIPATVLIFVVGIIKYGERVYSLYSGSVDGVLSEIIGHPDPGPNYEKFMSLYSSKEKAGLPVDLAVLTPRPLVEQVQEENISLEAQAYKFFCIFRQLCFDVKPSYKERTISKAYFLGSGVTKSSAKAFEVIELELNFMYDMVHTKEPIAHSKAGCVGRFLASACLVSSFLVFFFHSDKGGITRVDVAITYALLLGGMALDAAALAMLFVSNWTLVFLEKTPRLAWFERAARSLRPRQRYWRRWKEDTSQLNLINYCLGIPQPGWVVRTLAMVPKKLHVREIFHDFFFIGREPLRPSALQIVFDVLKQTAEMGQQTSSCRGEGVLKELRGDIENNLTNATREAAWEEEDEEVIKKKLNEKLAVLDGSVGREFAESLLMWHIATDLCSSPLESEEEDITLTEEAKKMRQIAKTLSGYMLYLLIKQPKILLASAGIGLKQYQDTCAEAKRFFKTKAAATWQPNDGQLRKMLLSVSTDEKPSVVKGNLSKSVLFDGVILAKALRDLEADLMWKVVARVWGEMLTYAAGKCKGSTHVQQLSRGGELITMVWFLMAHMGLSEVYKVDDKHDVELVPKLIVHH